MRRRPKSLSIKDMLVNQHCTSEPEHDVLAKEHNSTSRQETVTCRRTVLS